MMWFLVCALVDWNKFAAFELKWWNSKFIFPHVRSGFWIYFNHSQSMKIYILMCGCACVCACGCGCGCVWNRSNTEVGRALTAWELVEINSIPLNGNDDEIQNSSFHTFRILNLFQSISIHNTYRCVCVSVCVCVFFFLCVGLCGTLLYHNWSYLNRCRQLLLKTSTGVGVVLLFVRLFVCWFSPHYYWWQ